MSLQLVSVFFAILIAFLLEVAVEVHQFPRSLGDSANNKKKKKNNKTNNKNNVGGRYVGNPFLCPIKSQLSTD